MTECVCPTTLADVARLAGVSKMTASNVINGKPGMSEATRQRVLGAVERSGYVGNPAARVLAGRSMNLIGVMAPVYNSPYVTELIHGASAAAEDAGTSLAMFTTSGNGALERERAALLRTMADGVLLILPSTDEPPVFRGVVPVVTAGGVGEYTVQGDNAHGGRLAARHLLELGHRRIAHIRGATHIAINRQEALAREAGFLEAMAEAGVSVPPEYLVDGNFDEQAGEAAAETLLRLPTPPTAIFAANDGTAFGVLRAAERLGVRVPGDLSLVGFDDVTSSALTSPALTTIRQPLQEMGAAAVRMLLTLGRGMTPPEVHPLFPTSLIVRRSTAPPGAPP